MFKHKKVIVGKKFCSIGRIFVHGIPGRIYIGHNNMFISSPNVNPTGGGEHMHLRVEHNGMIRIGNHVGITRAEIASFHSIEIEDNVLIGGNVKIWDTDFHSLDYEKRMEEKEFCGETAPIRICEGAFIGANSIILKGVTIGKRSVIGAGSVVTKSIPANEVWGGNPAKFIKKLED